MEQHVDLHAVMLNSMIVPFPKIIRDPPTSRDEQVKNIITNLDANRETVSANIKQRFTTATAPKPVLPSQLPQPQVDEQLKKDNAALVAALKTPRNPKISNYMAPNKQDITDVNDLGLLETLLEDYNKHAEKLKRSYSQTLSSMPRQESVIAVAPIRSTNTIMSPANPPLKGTSGVSNAPEPAAALNRRSSSGVETAPPRAQVANAASSDVAHPTTSNPFTSPTQPRRTSVNWTTSTPTDSTAQPLRRTSNPIDPATSTTSLLASLLNTPWHVTHVDITRELGEAATSSQTILACLHRLADYDISWADARQTIRSNRQRGQKNEGFRPDMARFHEWDLATIEQVFGPLPRGIGLRAEVARARAQAQALQRTASQDQRRATTTDATLGSSLVDDVIMQGMDGFGGAERPASLALQIPSVALMGQAPMVASPASTLTSPADGRNTSAGVGTGVGNASMIDRDRDPRRR